MSKSYLRANVHVLMDSEPYLIERQCSDGVWVLKHEQTGRSAERSAAELHRAYLEGTLKFQPLPIRNISMTRTRPNRVGRTDVDPERLSRATIRSHYAKAAVRLPSTEGAILGAIEQVWASLSAQPHKKPSWISVYRWAKAYEESGNDTSALIDSSEAKGNRTARYPDEVIDICRETIDSDYLTLERQSLVHVTNLARAKIRRHNAQANSSETYPLPTETLVQRLISEIPAYDVHVARYGRDAARKKFRNSTKCRVTEEVLRRAEMDHTRMNVFVVDEEHAVPLGRPWLTILIDDFSRYVLGYCLSFESPSRATVARCLKFALLPKDKLNERYPKLKNSWDSFGVMQELVVDGGPEFHSDELNQICFELDIEQHFSPRKEPWFKGKVERLQGTLNREVCISMPGKTFEGIVDRDDYDPKKHAVISLSALEEVIVRWIVDVYHQKHHSGIGCKPAQMWATWAKPQNLAFIQDPLRFDAILGGRGDRRLTHKGVEFNCLFYNSPELGDLRRTLGDVLNVQIRFDRSNLGSIIVMHPERNTLYRVPCLRSDYAEGLTEWQHNVCRTYATKKRKAASDVDDWLDALLEISELVDSEILSGKQRVQSRERMARWKNGRDAKTVPPERSEVTPKAPAQFQVDASPTVIPGPKSTRFAAPRKRFTPVFDDRRTADAIATPVGNSRTEVDHE